MGDVATWMAPAATMIAAMMTAANLGSRVTGWGFVIFTIGSLTWSYIGFSTDQPSLLITNGFLTAVNLVGVWRWLGRQTKLEEGSKTAERRSASGTAPALVAGSGIVGQAAIAQDGEDLGQIVDFMVQRESGKIAYVVITDGGIAGVQERLRAVDRDLMVIADDQWQVKLTRPQFEALAILDPEDWPEQANRPTNDAN